MAEQINKDKDETSTSNTEDETNESTSNTEDETKDETSTSNTEEEKKYTETEFQNLLKEAISVKDQTILDLTNKIKTIELTSSLKEENLNLSESQLAALFAVVNIDNPNFKEEAISMAKDLFGNSLNLIDESNSFTEQSENISLVDERY